MLYLISDISEDYQVMEATYNEVIVTSYFFGNFTDNCDTFFFDNCNNEVISFWER